MEKVIGNYYINNGKIEEFFILPEAPLDSVIIYEVLRIIKSIPLFYQDHFMRLINSVYLAGYNYDKLPDKEKLLKEILILIKQNNFSEGNLKLGFIFKDKEFLSYKIYFIPHKYPTIEDYIYGIRMISLQAERKYPNIKIRNKSLREKTDEIIKKSGVYEVLLVNENGFVTEGSRSNIFFIKENKLYSAYNKDILQGITLKYVRNICKNYRYEIIEKNIKLSELKEYDSCFITGTSPKILPVAKIDNISFFVNNPIISDISYAYDEIIENYINYFFT